MISTELGSAILHEVQELNRRMQRLEQQMPTVAPEKVWLTPAEMSKLCNVSTRTLLNYVNSGRLSPAAVKQQRRGKSFNFRYHRELTLTELGIR
jgi:hypothetical protein